MDGGGIYGDEESDRRGSLDRENLSGLGSQVIINPLSAKWTDEKHSLYLTSMEASFIDQLYNSELRPHDLLGWLPRRHVQLQDQLSSRGCWGSLKYERVNTPRDIENIEKESHCLSTERIRHFRSSIRREECGLSPDQLSLNKSVGEVNSVHKPWHRRGANKPTPTACYPHLCRLDSVGSSSEVTDQNFSDEDHRGKSNSAGKRRRVRMSAAHGQFIDQVICGQYKDQVVPSGLPFGAPSTVNNTSDELDDKNMEPEPHSRDT